MEIIAVSAVTALIVSVVYNKISAAHTFKVIDGYVKDMVDLTKKLISDAYSNKSKT